jgi:hypothetical protein
MAKFEELVLLVNSLTKAEKRYFKLFTSILDGDKHYLTVFLLIEKGVLDRKQVKEEFYNLYPKAAFDVSLKYLMKVILKSLRYSESQDQIDIYLLGQLLDIRQLYKKGIYNAFLSESEKFKELAIKYERHFMFLEVSYLEMEHFTRFNFPDISEEKLIEIQNKIKEVLDVELKVNNHLTLYQLLLHRFLFKGVARSEMEMSNLNDLVLTENAVFGTSIGVDSFQSQQLHLLFQSVYFKVIGSPELSLEIYYDLDKLFQKNKLIWERNPLYYVYLIEGILLNLVALQEYNSMPFFIHRLHQMNELHGEDTPMKAIAYKFELLFHIWKGELAEANTLLNKIHPFMKALKLAGSSYAAKLEYCQALVCFGLGDWKNCLRSISFVLHEKDTSIEEYRNLARMIALLVHFEKQDYDYLEHEIRSFERALKKQGNYYKLEKALFEMLRNSMKQVDLELKKSALTKFKTTLNELAKDQYEARLIFLFDFQSWADAKTEGVSLVDLVKNKNLK